MNERIGDWIQTYSGRRWWPHDPRSEDVNHEDFPAIAQIVRFGGHCRGLYTVAQHSCLVHDHLVMTHLSDVGLGWYQFFEVLRRGDSYWTLCASALTHDLHEIYPPGDQLAPFLRLDAGEGAAGVAWLKRISKRAAWCVRMALDVPVDLADSVKHADLAALATERRDVMSTPDALLPYWAGLPEPWSKRIEVWPAERAWAEWAERFEKLFGYVPGA
jgi:hypothetical protein